MREVGQKLKQIRLDKGIYLEDIEEATKVRVKYLEAIEEGNLDKLPGQIYAMGFIRSYVRYLGVDEEEIIGYYKDHYKNLNKQSETEHVHETEHIQQSVSRARAVSNATPHMPIKTRQKTFGARFIWLVLVLIIVGSAVALYIIGTSESQNDVTGAPKVTDNNSAVNPTDTTNNAGSDTTGGVNNPTNPVTPTEPTTPDVNQEPVFDGVTVKVTVKGGTCWVGVTSDGTNYTEETLKDGDTREYMAEEKLSIRFGNAGVVQTEYNGQIVNPVGAEGQVKTVEFTK